MILLISASQIARITGVSHWHPENLTALRGDCAGVLLNTLQFGW
jgi:hypothetical protein